MQQWPSGSSFTKHLNLNVISTLTGIIRRPTSVVTTYCAKIKTKMTENNLNTVCIWYCTSIGKLHSRHGSLVALMWVSRQDQLEVCVCVYMTHIRKASQCQCFIFLENLNEFANKSVVFLCSLLRAVFTDTHPAVLLKRAPAEATLRISQGAQFHVWVVCWRIFYSKTIFFFATALSSYGGGKRGLWRARAEGEDQTRVVHQADVSITTPDSEKNISGWNYIVINWERDSRFVRVAP